MSLSQGIEDRQFALDQVGRVFAGELDRRGGRHPAIDEPGFQIGQPRRRLPRRSPLRGTDQDDFPMSATQPLESLFGRQRRKVAGLLQLGNRGVQPPLELGGIVAPAQAKVFARKTGRLKRSLPEK